MKAKAIAIEHLNEVNFGDKQDWEQWIPALSSRRFT